MSNDQIFWLIVTFAFLMWMIELLRIIRLGKFNIYPFLWFALIALVVINHQTIMQNIHVTCK